MTDVLRPAAGGVAARFAAWAISHAEMAFRVLRAVRPILRLGTTTLVTRYDDVREVFEADADFPVPYAAKLEIIMGGEPFFLGMGNTADYRRDTAAMRSVIRGDDIPARLVPATNALAGRLVAEAAGRAEVVDLSRRVTFDVLCDYFGVPAMVGADLRTVATRLFEFQFADPGGDPALRAEVDQMAPALRAHIDAAIAAAKAAPTGRDDVTARAGRDDVIARCVAMQAQGKPGFTDAQIRCGLIGMIVGGLPQPPMVVPQALEQLLRRPAALAGAQRAAMAGDDTLLAGTVFEALRFDPLAPALPRTVAAGHVIAEGTPRAVKVAPGGAMLVSFASAMMDPRRVPEPERFNPQRQPHEYLHFGHGLHTCFGIHINQALLPLMLKPLLCQPRLRRAPGTLGRLTKRGAFADRLWVEWG